MNNNYLGLSTNMGKKGNPIENVSIKKLKDKLTKEYEYVNQTDEYNFLDENGNTDSEFMKDWLRSGFDLGLIDISQKEDVIDWIKVLINR